MSMWVSCLTWDDVPHLTKEMKDEYLEKIPPHLRDVRTKGMPTFGAGLVWPVDLEQISIAPFSIPNQYYRSFSLDTGWKANGCLFAAEDRQNNTVYIYDCFQRGLVEPPVIAAAVQSRGKWLQGVADAKNVSQKDGKQFFDIYKGLGLNIELPNKAIETGITATWHALTTGRIRIFSTCSALFDALRIYMRDGNGKIKEDQDDHLCDALRYLIMSGLRLGKQPPSTQMPDFDWESRPGTGTYGYMG